METGTAHGSDYVIKGSRNSSLLTSRDAECDGDPLSIKCFCTFVRSRSAFVAHSHAFQLSRDLMVPVTVFEVDGAYGLLPSDEIDASDDLDIVHEFIPWPAH